MRIQIMSDLHLDLRKDKGLEFISQMDPTGVDVLVIAGDLAELGHECYGRVVRGICEKYPEVVYVTGNHEWWNITRADGEEVLAGLSAQLPNFHVLQDRAVTIGGQRFVGSTLWWGRNDWSRAGLQRWIDCRKSKDLIQWIWKAEKDARTFLEGTVVPSDVVVTHFLPLTKSLDPRYISGPHLLANDNCYYINDMAYMFQRRRMGKLWVHGHTHCRFDYMAGDTRVLCNPLGNVGEPTRFDPKLVVEM